MASTHDQPRGDGTRVVNAGISFGDNGSPLGPNPVFAAPYVLRGEPSGPYQYGRLTNPTWSAWEAALAELEGGPVVAFSSGLAAVTAVLSAVLRPGDLLLIADDCYYATRRFATGYLSEIGVRIRTALTGPDIARRVDGARLVWVESPSNPRLDVCDLTELAASCHASGALLAVDNTTATPLAQQPLLLGADFSVTSDTKATCGHSDLVLGHVACRTDELAERVRTWRNTTGAIPGPFETWLAHRSLATLDLRLARQAENARVLADFLRRDPRVDAVRHPWLPDDPAYPIATRQMRRGIGLLSFTLPDAAAAETFLDALRIVTVATSFGGVHSTAERRARWGGDDVPAGFIRFSCGCEDPADLLADVDQALARLNG
ncbi:MAG: cystathionine gamma-lyase [Acidothermus sp.]|nr:cystathionine gamma-lyase [Acidothermus sp.]MCL6537166.1 cystathionine gamma-lyase [Acidothermus sp.]